MVIIVGILSAIAVPNLLGYFSRTQVDASAEALEGVLRQAQREAIRRSQTCAVVVPSGSNPVLRTATNTEVAGSNEDCLPSRNLAQQAGSGQQIADLTLRDIRIDSNLTGSPASIGFTFKGTPTNTAANTVVVLSSTRSSTSARRCIVISDLLGLIRSGNYDGSPTNPTEANCRIRPQ
ncbi:pilus assembly FimT family protein [Synechococcus elongatus]|uniref:pilus assembly FimT family protein n=1 Tax=Synechococcus elongatus TaxID=32046 RepID=UPI001374B11F|nr:GspH/FimT family pseudopilin [Synechococcus elongatus]